MASHLPQAAAVVDDDIVQHGQCLQKMLASLNQEIARQILQGPLNSAQPNEAADDAALGPEADLQETQDDIDQGNGLCATAVVMSSEAPSADASTVPRRPRPSRRQHAGS